MNLLFNKEFSNLNLSILIEGYRNLDKLLGKYRIINIIDGSYKNFSNEIMKKIIYNFEFPSEKNITSIYLFDLLNSGYFKEVIDNCNEFNGFNKITDIDFKILLK